MTQSKQNIPTGFSPSSGWDRANEPDTPDEPQPEHGWPTDKWRIQFSTDQNASEHQRDQANEDMRFIMVAGGQWEGWIGDQFATNRPRFEMDQVYERYHIFLSQFAESKPGVNYQPATGSNTNEDQCKILNGLFRTDMRRDNGGYAIYNSVAEAAAGGVGAFRFRCKFEDEDDDENLNQVIHVEPIHAAYSSVIWDANAKRYDKRDAKHCHVVTFMTTEAFEKRFPGAAPASVPIDNDRREFNWNTPGGVYVAEYYWVDEVIKTSYLLNNPQTNETLKLFEDEYKPAEEEYLARGFQVVRTRKKTVRVVYKAIYSGITLLEEPVEIVGKYIPIVPVYAFWMFLDGQEQYFGLVRKQKDPQRLWNMQASSLGELAATSVKRQPIFAPEQMVGPGIKDLWSEAHLGNTNYLLANPLRDESGQILAQGPMGYMEPPEVNPAMAAVLQLTSDYMRQTGTLAPTELPNREVSGDAIRQMSKRVDLKTYGIMENVYNSLLLAGDIYKEMAKVVYSERRKVRLTNEDDRQVEMIINDQKVNPNNGMVTSENSIANARFDCYPDIGPSYASLREEAKESFKELLQTMPADSPYYPVVMTEYMRLLNGTTPTFDNFVRQKELEMGLRPPETPEEQQYVQQLEQQRSQPSPQDQLVQAAAESEAADAAKKRAEVEETQANTQESLSKIAVNESTALLNRAKARAEGAEATGFSRVANVVNFPRSGQGAS